MPIVLQRLLFINLLLVCTLHSHQHSKSYVLDNPDWLLVPKSVEFIETLSHELYSKTGYSLYVAVVDKTPNMEQNQNRVEGKSIELQKNRRDEYKKSLTKELKSPYGVIFFMKNDEKMGITSSNHEYFDEDKVYFEYMVPLLPKQKEEILTPQLISAIVLNGYATAADMIAKHFDIKLQNNMPLDESGGRELVRFSMYIMLLSMFGIIGIIYLTRKK